MEDHGSSAIFAAINRLIALNFSKDLIPEILGLKFILLRRAQITRKPSGNQNIVSMYFGLLTICFDFVGDLPLANISIHNRF
jgi:hypothetical protein